MATLQQLEAALVKADAAGNADDARAFASEIRKMRAAPVVPVAEDRITQGAKNFAKDMPLGEQVLAGVGKAIVDTGRGIKGLFTDNSADVAESRRLDAPLMDTGGGFTGNIAGNVGMALAPGGALKGAATLGRAAGLGARGLDAAGTALLAPTTVRGAAGVGAGMGLAQPAENLSERAINTLMGGAAGGGGQAAFQGLSRVVAPRTPAGVRALMDEGITPTPGQILGGGFKRAEEGLTSVPIVGDAIKSAQTRAVGDLNRAAFNRALEPIGEKLPKGLQGREAIEYAENALKARYEGLMPRLTTQADGQFISDVQNLRNMVGEGAIDPAMADRFEKILNNQLLVKFKGDTPTLTGETLKQVESDLGNLARQFGASPDPDQRLLGDAIRETQDILRKTVERSNPAVKAELSSINKGYANFKRVQRAAAGVGAEDGVFSAAQLQNAVKASDKSKDKGAFARGSALMQDLSDNAKTVLGPKVPDSGTPFRTLLTLGSAGGAGLISPGAAMGVLAAPVAYSRPGQAALAALLARRPQGAANVGTALERLGNYSVAPAIGVTEALRE